MMKVMEIGPSIKSRIYPLQRTFNYIKVAFIFWIGVGILKLEVWSRSGSESRLFTYTGMEIWNGDQNPIYMFTLSWIESK